MHLTVCGFNHKSAKVEQREPFQIARRDLAEATRMYKEINGCPEVVAVATCNRVEFYRVSGEKRDPIHELREFYRRWRGVGTQGLAEICYIHQETTAARHLFRVASGLDSMVLGEDQVFHQLKDAYSAACAVQGPGKILHKIFHMAFQAGKRVRAETQICAGPRSVSGAALELYHSRMGEKAPAAALVCGVNEMTEIILEGLTRWGVPAVLANRSLQKAEKLAAAFRARSLPIEEVRRVLDGVDAIFSATSAPSFILHPEHFDGIPLRSTPLYIFDLAIPRDVDPRIGRREDVLIFDMEDVQRFLDHSEEARSEEIPRAEAIIEEQVHAYSLWRTRERQQEKILQVHRELNRMRQRELERFKEGFHLSEYRALDAFSQALVRNFMRLLPEALGIEEKQSNPEAEKE
jgi:glutamyl-tRNA reductase